MPALASPVADERSALREYLSYHHSAFFAVAYGLTDEQARLTPTVSELSVGGLVKHVTGMQRTWMSRVAAAIPGARFVVIDGMGHDLPEPVWQPILEAMAENFARAGHR